MGHRRAALTPFGRRIVVDRVLVEGRTQAATDEGACDRARRQTEESYHSYLNGDDQKVEWVFGEVLNAFWIQDPELKDGTGIYSSFITEEESRASSQATGGLRLSPRQSGPKPRAILPV